MLSTSAHSYIWASTSRLLSFRTSSTTSVIVATSHRPLTALFMGSGPSTSRPPSTPLIIWIGDCSYGELGSSIIISSLLLGLGRKREKLQRLLQRSRDLLGRNKVMLVNLEALKKFKFKRYFSNYVTFTFFSTRTVGPAFYFRWLRRSISNWLIVLYRR